MAASFSALNGDGISPHFYGFLCMFQSAHRWHANDASIAQSTNDFLVRTSAIAYGANPILDRKVKQLLRVSLKHMKVQTKWFVTRQMFDLKNIGLNALSRNRGAGKKSKCAGIARGRNQAWSSDPAHGRLNNWHFATEQVAKWGSK
jgi:hypothetical protein